MCFDAFNAYSNIPSCNLTQEQIFSPLFSRNFLFIIKEYMQRSPQCTCNTVSEMPQALSFLTVFSLLFNDRIYIICLC